MYKGASISPLALDELTRLYHVTECGETWAPEKIVNLNAHLDRTPVNSLILIDPLSRSGLKRRCYRRCGSPGIQHTAKNRTFLTVRMTRPQDVRLCIL
jgi:hypothetical protein